MALKKKNLIAYHGTALQYVTYLPRGQATLFARLWLGVAFDPFFIAMAMAFFTASFAMAISRLPRALSCHDTVYAWFTYGEALTRTL